MQVGLNRDVRNFGEVKDRGLVQARLVSQI